MSQTIEEAVARAICAVSCANGAGCAGDERCWDWQANLDESKAAIRAHIAALEAAGFQVVPIEATEAMKAAAEGVHDVSRGAADAIWTLMSDAAEG